LVSSHRVRKAVLTENCGETCSSLYFADVLSGDDDFMERVLGGFTTFALNQGEACGSPSRAFVELPIYHEFVEAASIRTKAIRQGNPLDTETMLGAQTSAEQLAKILAHVELGASSGLRVITGGARAELGGELENGYYMQPTIVEATDSLWEATLGPVVSVASFENYAAAVRMANAASDSCSAAVWARDLSLTYYASRDLRATRLFANCSPAYAAQAAFGRLDQPPVTDYQRRKSLVLSYGPQTPSPA
jgi:aldehyde dehydrogenase